MNIAFNLLSAKAGAGISVARNLLHAIAELDKTNTYFVFLSKNQMDLIKALPSSQNIRSVILKFVPQNPYLRVLYEQFILPIYLIQHRIDVLYSVGNITTLLAPCKILLFIENTNPLSKLSVEWSPGGKIRNKLLYILGFLSAKRADRIRYCSERSMEIINRMYKIDAKKTFVLHHGIDLKKFTKGNQKPFNFNYILSVSVVVPHKNFEILIKAFYLLIKNSEYKGKLVIIGDTKYYENYYNKLKDMVNTLSINDEVIFTDKIDNNELPKFYEHADLFVFPSNVETFGIPLIEAMVFDAPVLCSDGKKYPELFIPFNEIAGDYAVYFDPFSETDLFNKMKDSLFNTSHKQNLTGKEIFIKQYSINVIAGKLIDEFKNMKNRGIS